MNRKPTDADPKSAPPADVKPEKDRGPITLVQFLKVVDAAPTGGNAKALIRDGQVQVNGTPEDRPGRKLAKGDVVMVGDQEFVVDR